MVDQQHDPDPESSTAALRHMLQERERTIRQQGLQLQEVTDELQQRIRDAEAARVASERYAARMRFLAEAGKRLAGSLDYETTLSNIADLAVPAIADWCVIDLVDSDGRLRRLVVSHPDPAMVQRVEELNERYPDDPESRHGVHEVVRTGIARLVPEITPELIRQIARDEEHRRIIESLELGSYVIVPLRARDSVTGALTLVCKRTSCFYGPEDLEMAEELAMRAGLAIENARLVSSLEQTQQHLESTATELESKAEELQAAVEELEATTQELLESNEELTTARAEADAARRVAEEANAAKSQFLATMSHELRTPLNAIDGYAELMELEIHGPITPQQREALRRLRRAQKRLLSLINDVLNFAKLESGQVALRMGDVRLADVLTDVEAVILPQVSEKEQTLIFEAESADMRVHADAQKVEQILLNLLTNAIKFTGDGGHIRVSTARTGSNVEVRVADTGAGIPKERLETIFEPFVQVSSGMIRDHGGVGLGLAISRDLAQRMNGDLRVSSELDGGSTFTLVLPLYDRHGSGSGNPVRSGRGEE